MTRRITNALLILFGSITGLSGWYVMLSKTPIPTAHYLGSGILFGMSLCLSVIGLIGTIVDDDASQMPQNRL